MTQTVQTQTRLGSRMKFFGTLVLALTLVVPTAAFAGDNTPDPELRLSVSGASLRNASEQTSYVSEDRGLERFELGLSYEIVRNLLFGLDYATGRSSRFVSSGWDSQLSMRSVGGRFRYLIEVYSFFRPYLTVGGGIVLGRMELDLENSTVSDNALGYYVDGAAGFEIFTPGRISVGFATDSGYAYRTPLRFDDAQPGSNDGPRTPIELGELRFRGYQWRGGAFVRATF